MSEETAEESADAREDGLTEANVRVVRIGHGANCSSVGSVIDTLFLSAAVGGAIFAAVCAAMKVESVTVVGDVGVEEADESSPGDGRGHNP